MTKNASRGTQVHGEATDTPRVRLRAGLLLALVALNIALQLVNASLMKFASRLSAAQLGLLAAVLGLVAVLSFGRFVVWGATHKRFPVSIAYPATALFFPCLVAVAAAFGEPVSTAQIVGAGVVTLGVLMLLLPSGYGQDESLA
jgi:multidrug transporter EmrE-like cation transporter